MATAPKTKDTSGAGASGAGTGPKTNPPRVSPLITAATASVPMPDRNTNRGSKTSYPFDTLTAPGMSFGVKNKTAKQLASIISNQNKKLGPALSNPDGSPKFKMQTMMDQNNQPMKDASGNVIQAATTEREYGPSKKYFAVDRTAADKDPDGAQVRVFRQE